MERDGPRFPTVEGIDVQAIVGRGGFATVYRATQAGLDRTVALKVIHPGLHADPDMVRRFERECQAIGSLTGHPSVMTIFQAGTTAEGDPFMVLEYLPNGSLHERLAATGPLPWQEVMAVAVSLCEALDAAHGIGIIHRDVKPANVLQDRFGRSKLGDFGIAGFSTSNSTSFATTATTVAYAAPEVLLGKRATVSSDLYGLGATLYALCVGTPAFSADTDESIVPMIMRVTNQPLAPLPPTAGPEPFRSLIQGLMAKEPADRPATAAEVLERLQAMPGSVSPPKSAPVRATDAESHAVDLSALDQPTNPGASRDAHIDAPTVAPARARGSVAPGLANGVTPTMFTAAAPSSAGSPPTVISGGPAGSAPTSTPTSSATSGEPVAATRAPAAGRRRKLVIAAVAAVSFLLVAGIAAGLGSAGGGGDASADRAGGSTSPRSVRVPSVIGLPLDKALAALEAAGFKGSVTTRRVDPTAAKGAVANQDPAPGDRRPTGTTISLAVSTGQPPGTVPQLVGKRTESALEAIDRAGYVLGGSKFEASDKPAGTIIRIQPAAGTKVARGAKIGLVISSGPAATTVPPSESGPDATTRTTRPPSSGGGSATPVTQAPAPTMGTSPPTTRPPTTYAPTTRPPTTRPPTTSPPTTVCHTYYYLPIYDELTHSWIPARQETKCTK